MRTLIWITITATLYTAPMTVEYTADGYSYLIDTRGNEWVYEQELGGEEVTVLLDNNGTPEPYDDIIVDIQDRIDL